MEEKVKNNKVLITILSVLMSVFFVSTIVFVALFATSKDKELTLSFEVNANECCVDVVGQIYQQQNAEQTTAPVKSVNVKSYMDNYGVITFDEDFIDTLSVDDLRVDSENQYIKIMFEIENHSIFAIDASVAYGENYASEESIATGESHVLEIGFDINDVDLDESIVVSIEKSGDKSTYTEFVGYDGYIWRSYPNGETEKTNTIVQSNMTTDLISENTLGLTNSGVYYQQDIIDFSNSQVALMTHYFNNINKTGYSGALIGSLSIYAVKAGELTVGTASVEEIVASKTNGESVALTNSISFTLQKGTNLLTLNDYFVEENSTLVLGETGDSAITTFFKEVPTNDEQGVFCLLDGSSSNEVVSTTGAFDDKLAIKVNLTGIYDQIYSGDVVSINDGIETALLDQDGWRSESTSTNMINSTSYDLNKYSSLKVSYIRLFVRSVSSLTEDQTFTVNVVKNYYPYEIVKSYQFVLPADEINIAESTTGGADSAYDENTGRYILGRWRTLYCNEEVVTKGDETLSFYAGADVDSIRISTSNGDSRVSEWQGITSLNMSYTWGRMCIFVDVYGQRLENVLQSYSARIEELSNQNRVLESLEGKKISIIGDSISTWEGISNNPDANVTTENNPLYYTNDQPRELESYEDTWWMQAINGTGMELLVNNSWSGAKVNKKGIEMSTELDNNEGVSPDIVAVYMGVNDFHSYGFCGDNVYDDEFFKRVESSDFIPTSFDEAYALMIYQIKAKYNADIYLFNIPYNGKIEGLSGTHGLDNMNNLLAKYNEAISAIAEHYNCTLVDLNSTELSTDYDTLTGDGLHPNMAGMDIITNLFVEAIENNYLTNEQTAEVA